MPSYTGPTPRIAALLLAVLCAIPINAQFKVNVDANVSATVGLDNRTTQLIQNLPTDVRIQLIETLKEALPLLDKSVDAYFNRVNQIMDNELLNAQCAMTGVAADADRRVTLKEPLGPIQTFDKHTAVQLQRLGRFDGPEFYSKVYGDISYDATVTFCEMKISDGGANLRSSVNKYRRLNDVWLRLDDSCSSPRNCVAKQVQATRELITNSDLRDVRTSNADTHFSVALSSVPENPWIWQSFSPTPYNETLLKLFAIQDEIALAQQVRRARASALIAEARDSKKSVDDEIKAAQQILVPIPAFLCKHVITDDMVSRAQAQADAIRQTWIDDKTKLDTAISIDSGHKAEAEKVRAELESRRPEYDEIRNAHRYESASDPGCSVH